MRTPATQPARTGSEERDIVVLAQEVGGTSINRPVLRDRSQETSRDAENLTRCALAQSMQRVPDIPLPENGFLAPDSSTEVVTLRDETTLQSTQQLPSTEEQIAPEPQQESERGQANFPIDPQLLQNTVPFPVEATGNELGKNIGEQNADAWLHHMFNGSNYEGWIPEVTNNDPSPLTSVPTEPHTATPRIHKSCQCAAHQPPYDDWPTRDAELRIAKCMTICMYCGVNYGRPPTLRQHLKSAKHAQDNISVVVETQGRGSATTPPWILKPRIEGIFSSQRSGRRINTIRTNTASSQSWDKKRYASCSTMSRSPETSFWPASSEIPELQTWTFWRYKNHGGIRS